MAIKDLLDLKVFLIAKNVLNKDCIRWWWSGGVVDWWSGVV